MLRVALLTLESPLSTPAVAALLAAAPAGVRFVLIARSTPAAAPLAQLARHWRRSGPRLLPWLLANYALPPLRGGLGPLAARHGIPLRPLPADPTALLAEVAAELVVTLHCDRILPPELLAGLPRGGLNLHPSWLPRGRGPTPVLHALAEPPAADAPGPRFGVTLHRLAAAIDAGPILLQAAHAPPPGASASAITRALHLAGVPLLVAALAAEAAGTPLPEHPMPAGPYQSFPSRHTLAALARHGHSLVTAADLGAALLPRP